jgi:RNA-binding protein YlmH
MRILSFFVLPPISIQGFGRAMITDIGGKTKKDKIRISYKTLFK